MPCITRTRKGNSGQWDWKERQGGGTGHIDVGKGGWTRLGRGWGWHGQLGPDPTPVPGLASLTLAAWIQQPHRLGCHVTDSVRGKNFPCSKLHGSDYLPEAEYSAGQLACLIQSRTGLGCLAINLSYSLETNSSDK